MASIEQVREKDFRKFTTLADGLQVEYRSGEYYRSYKLEYEDIDFDEIVASRTRTFKQLVLFGSATANAVLLIALLVALFGFQGIVAWLVPILTVASALAAYYWWKNMTRGYRNKILEGSEDLVFFYNPEHETAVDAFIVELKDAKKKYLYAKYLRFDNLLPLEGQKANVDWLYEQEQIDRRVYQVYVEEYQRRLLIRGN